jgi:translation initiation factor 2 beta subunit (eIF-2beta)/eIF-5
MRYQELASQHNAEMSNAFSDVVHCLDCGSQHPMTIKSVYSALFRNQDILFCRCEECGAERAALATS